MLGLVIAFFAGGFVGLCVGVWLVADNVRHSSEGCVVCGRPWQLASPHTHGSSAVRLIEPADIDVALDAPHDN